MSAISVEIMKIIDEREKQKKTKNTHPHTKKDLICKASLIFKSNLELALSKAILKGWKLNDFVVRLS